MIRLAYKRLKNPLYFSALILMALCLSTGCSKDDDPIDIPTPNTCLKQNDIIISDIADIPEGVLIDQVKAEITGNCWDVIDVVEASYAEGTVTLSLPATFSTEKLQRVVRSDDKDYCAFWRASADNKDALVAGLGDIFAYSNNKRVGRIYLSDWTGQGSSLEKSFVYYHFADRDFTLSGTYRTYTYQATFRKGWNAYINTNILESDEGSVLCTTTIPEEKQFTWRLINEGY